MPDGLQKLKKELASYDNAENKKSAGYGASATGGSVVKDYSFNVIEAGDRGIVREELYGKNAVQVLKINGKKNTVTVEVPLFGWMQRIEMDGLDVVKVGSSSRKRLQWTQ